MAKEDVNKTVFHCLGFIGPFESVVMTWFEECRCNVSKSYELNLP
jgi:hypothetical protein